jgi:hypothetical protein
VSAISAIALASTIASLRAIEPAPGDDEVRVAPSDVRYVETRLAESVIRRRPWVPNRRLATLAKGTRLVVSGEVESRDPAGCGGKKWYAVAPFGFMCSQDVRPTKKAPVVEPALRLQAGQHLPFTYAFVRDGGAPYYASVDDARAGVSARELEKGMSVVVEKSIKIDGQSFVLTADGGIIPKANVTYGGQGSSWQGVWIDGDAVGLSFGWITPAKTKVYVEPQSKSEIRGELLRRDRIPLFEEKEGEDKRRWLRIGESAWVMATDVNEVRLLEIPDGVYDLSRRAVGNALWFDVDTGEQVMVAYHGRTPFFATLVSSGRSVATPLGNYPIWAKVASMTMGNQDYEDNAYMVQGVPWVLLFQGHNAFHGAYWHDRFGNRKSHGCVNLSPRDARFVFEQTSLAMPAGWTGFLPPDLEASSVVHVRDSSLPATKAFVQERPTGPPDREEERKKLEEAELRRAQETQGLEELGLELVAPSTPTVQPPESPRP